MAVPAQILDQLQGEWRDSKDPRGEFYMVKGTDVERHKGGSVYRFPHYLRWDPLRERLLWGRDLRGRDLRGRDLRGRDLRCGDAARTSRLDPPAPRLVGLRGEMLQCGRGAGARLRSHLLQVLLLRG